jgi:hypothetical protein
MLFAMVLACAFAVAVPFLVRAARLGPPPVPYEVLSEWQVAGKLCQELLVAESTSRADAMALGEWLKQNHEGQFFLIFVYDSREAWRNRDNDRFPEKKFWRHYLVGVSADPPCVTWMAEGRGH